MWLCVCPSGGGGGDGGGCQGWLGDLNFVSYASAGDVGVRRQMLSGFWRRVECCSVWLRWVSMRLVTNVLEG